MLQGALIRAGILRSVQLIKHHNNCGNNFSQRSASQQGKLHNLWHRKGNSR